MPKQPDKPKKKPRRTSVTVGHEPDGTPVYRYPSGKTKKELGEKVKELKRIYGAGGPGVLHDVLFEDYAEKWLRSMEGAVSENSLTAYQSYVREHLVPAIGKIQVQNILVSDLKAAFAQMKTHEGKPLSASTKHHVLSRLRTIMRQAQEDRIRDDNPAFFVKLKTDVAPKRRALRVSEKDAALELITNYPKSNEALLTAMDYYTSCRRGEAFGLQWQHIDFRSREITIEQQLRYKKGVGTEIAKELKTRNSYRKMPLLQPLCDFLLPLRGHPEAFVLHTASGHYRMNDITELIKNVHKLAPSLHDVTPHYFRHNYATDAHNACPQIPIMTAARWMGESVSMMLKTYVHIEKEMGFNIGPDKYNIFNNVANLLLSSNGQKPQL
jgi:integrase